MARRVEVEGTATINGRMNQRFSDVVMVANSDMGGEKYEALQKKHPDWENINITNYSCDGKWY